MKAEPKAIDPKVVKVAHSAERSAQSAGRKLMLLSLEPRIAPTAGWGCGPLG